MRQEIIAHEEAQEYEIVDNPLEVVSKRELEVPELKRQVFADHVDLHELELSGLLQPTLVLGVVSSALGRNMTPLSAFVAGTVVRVEECFAHDVEVRFMGRQAQHDQIGISSQNTVLGVRVVLF